MAASGAVEERARAAWALGKDILTVLAYYRRNVARCIISWAKER